MMNVFLGGTLKAAYGHAAVCHEIGGLRPGYKTRTVNSFHNFVIEELGTDLEGIYRAKDQTIEAISHKTLSWVGMMWHPEREKTVSTEDTKLINKLFNLNPSASPVEVQN